MVSFVDYFYKIVIYDFRETALAFLRCAKSYLLETIITVQQLRKTIFVTLIEHRERNVINTNCS